MGEIKWMELNPVEKSRTYYFANQEQFTLWGVKRLEVRESGIHRYETSDGKKGFVATGWLRLEIDVEAWTC